MPGRPQKITFADMRDMDVRGLPLGYKCNYSALYGLTSSSP
jgi:hypothetical protein